MKKNWKINTEQSCIQGCFTFVIWSNTVYFYSVCYRLSFNATVNHKWCFESVKWRTEHEHLLIRSMFSFLSFCLSFFLSAFVSVISFCQRVASLRLAPAIDCVMVSGSSQGWICCVCICFSSQRSGWKLIDSYSWTRAALIWISPVQYLHIDAHLHLSLRASH